MITKVRANLVAGFLIQNWESLEKKPSINIKRTVIKMKMIIIIRLFYGTLQQTIKLQYNLNRMKLHKILIVMFKAPNSLSKILTIKNMKN